MTYDNQFDQIVKRDSIYIAIFSIIILCFEDPTVGLVEKEAVVLVDCKEVASTGFSLFPDRIIILTSSQTSFYQRH